MPKRKQVLVSKRYISFIKDKLPYSDANYWWELDENKLKKKEWVPPSKIPIKKDKDLEEGEETRGESKMARKIKKLKLKYTTVEVKKAIEEDEKSLKDVEKLEEHLEEDISKAKQKLKETKENK
jgi:hypothetical protein